MSGLIWLVIILLTIAICAYRKTTLMQGIWMVGAVILLCILIGDVSTLGKILFILLYGASAALLLHQPFRRKLISDPLFAWFKTVMPPISDTEREALEAGSVWWDAELFSGNPNWRKLLSFKPPKLNKAEQAFLDGPVEKLCTMVNDWEITEELKDLPPAVWDHLKKNKFFGMIIPESYGGLGFSAYAHSQVIMKISSRSTTAAVTAMVPNSLGPAELLLQYGTDEQKDYYLPRLAVGQEVPCFALTGLWAGSDAGAMTDTGIICKGRFNNKSVIGIKLNWSKRYITLAPVATLLGLAFKAYDPDNLLGEKTDLGITCALIPTDTKGVEIGQRHNPLNIPFQNGPTEGKDVFVPLDYIIGGEDYLGQGWKMLMNCLAAGRGISLPSQSAAAGKFSVYSSGAYARIREQFGVPVGSFEGVAEALARIGGETYRMEGARRLTLSALDAGEHPAVASAIMKFQLSEAMRRVINDAMDIHGGKGIMLGPKNYLGRAYQAVPVSITVEGANILTRSMIIFGQGAVRCHPYVLKEIELVEAEDNDTTRDTFDQILFSHLGFTISNTVRAVWLGLSRGRFLDLPGNPDTHGYLRKFSRYSATFSMLADITMLMLGGELKRREALSGRFADILGNLYLGSGIIKHFEDQGCPKNDLPIFNWACQDTLVQIQIAFDGILENYPNRFIGALLRGMLFPLGHRAKRPDDALNKQISKLLMQPGEVRDRLIDGIYLSEDANDVTGCLADTLNKVLVSAPIEEKLSTALKARLTPEKIDAQLEQGIAEEHITSDEAKIITTTASAKAQVLSVDAFNPKKNPKSKARTAPRKKTTRKTTPAKKVTKKPLPEK